jgi:hypothetical protein
MKPLTAFTLILCTIIICSAWVYVEILDVEAVIEVVRQGCD